MLPLRMLFQWSSSHILGWVVALCTAVTPTFLMCRIMWRGAPQESLINPNFCVNIWPLTCDIKNIQLQLASLLALRRWWLNQRNSHGHPTLTSLCQCWTDKATLIVTRAEIFNGTDAAQTIWTSMVIFWNIWGDNFRQVFNQSSGYPSMIKVVRVVNIIADLVLLGPDILFQGA